MIIRNKTKWEASWKGNGNSWKGNKWFFFLACNQKKPVTFVDFQKLRLSNKSVAVNNEVGCYPLLLPENSRIPGYLSRKVKSSYLYRKENCS